MITPKKTDYGTREYFTEMFNDVFCALSDDDADPDVMYQGMLDALNDLLNYHREACNRYEFMLERINKMREYKEHHLPVGRF